MQNNDFEQFLSEYQQNLDDPEWLSRAVIHLPAMLYELDKKVSQAELDEARIMVMYLDDMSLSKKMAVSEAEKRALVDTNNARHFLENSRESIKEMIQSIKKRLEVLSWDRKTNRY